MMILAGDIGGTKTRLALFRLEDKQLRLVSKQTYPSAKYAGLSELLAQFANESGHAVDCAGLGMPGPVIKGQVKTTNLPWNVDAADLARTLHLGRVELINDLEAHAHGLQALAAADFHVINQGLPDATGNAAVIAPGTGLGEAGLYWDGRRHHPFSCEGGHADFAPRTALEIELLRYLLGHYPHVSYERVVSGPGLHNIYRFLRDTGRGTELPEVAEAMRSEDPPAVISQAALDGRCELCSQALDMLVSLCGAEAGNLALKIMATGGIYISGGIAPRIIQRLSSAEFMAAFTSHGRMATLLQGMPVRVILNPDTALLGAALFAARDALQ
jgi:glucokinase